MKNRPLENAENIKAGAVTRVQLCPFGTWRNTAGGENQLCDQKAFAQIKAAFDAEGKPVLVDVDHESRDPAKRSVASAWVKSVSIDPAEGLTGELEWTPEGAALVATKEYKFLSPCWQLDASGRPSRLVSVGLTNCPNIPVEAVANRSDPGAMAGVPPQRKEERKMDKSILGALGLPPEATPEQAAAEIGKLKKKIADMEAAQNECAADKFAEENKAKCNREVLKKAYLANRELALAMVAGMPVPAAQKARQPVCNRETAVAPEMRLAGFAACKTPQERADFILANRETLAAEQRAKYGKEE